MGIDKAEFGKQAKEKVVAFVRSFENIYTEFLIEHAKSQEKTKALLNSLEEGKDIKETTRKVFMENRELQSKVQELESYVKEKQSYMDYAGVLEGDFQQQRVNQLSEELE